MIITTIARLLATTTARVLTKAVGPRSASRTRSPLSLRRSHPTLISLHRVMMGLYYMSLQVGSAYLEAGPILLQAFGQND